MNGAQSVVPPVLPLSASQAPVRAAWALAAALLLAFLAGCGQKGPLFLPPAAAASAPAGPAVPATPPTR